MQAVSEALAAPQTPVVVDAGEIPAFIPLQLHMECCATKEEMNGNVMDTVRRGYTRINEYLDQSKGWVAICGAAPSLRNRLEELKALKVDILACNSAIGFLLEHGIVPKWGMIWDAHPLCEQFATPHPDVTYLIGARCHWSVFERLKDCKVIAWHAGGDHNIAELMIEHKIDEPMINGGSAAVTRGMYLSVALGYRKIRIFGADSSYADNGDTHVRGASLVPEKIFRVSVGNTEGCQSFLTTPEWAAQIEEFKAIYANFRQIGVPVYSHCEGMWQHIYELLIAEMPHPTHEPAERQIVSVHQVNGEFQPQPLLTGA